MPDINLTEQEVQTLLRCLNDRVEPPEELVKKLFPKLYADLHPVCIRVGPGLKGGSVESLNNRKANGHNR
jgi:hypothetical protein